ncbi:hypothetical protein [Nostoc sp. KVJ3]|uniref:hypothetical protein n=1 Tax=Nostoc sp. KVJ3 TaxID=457945 RepID=UPI002238A684|nr:hypothetical protein [Nostoc sp. KVJ3]
MKKFYPLTPSMSQKLRKSKLTKHEMALWLYLIEKDPFGDRYWQLPSTLEITTELEMSKASYFRARARLQELELFDFQEQRVDCRNLTGVSKMRLESQNLDSESQKCDSKSQKCDSKSQKRDSKSQKRESQRSKPASGKGYEVSQTIHTYSNFINTLSESEKESFLEFGKKKAAELKNPPVQLPLKWIEKNFEELSEQWLPIRNKNENQNQKYNFAAYSEPQHQMWYGQLQALVYGAAQSGDGARLEQFLKDDFYSSWFNWAKTAREDVREFLASNPILTQNKRKSRVN